jgi:glycosyltransferase involved in cell wall biosynthesis
VSVSGEAVRPAAGEGEPAEHAAGDPLRILLVNEECIIGGIETWMIAMSSRLRMLGHRCDLFFFQHGPMEHQLPVGCVAHFGDLADLLRLVEQEAYQVVHAHSGDFILGLSAVRALGARLVVTSHGWLIPGWTSLTCDAFVGASEWLAEGQRSMTDLPVSTVMLGIDTDVFHPDPGAVRTSPPIVAWVGRGSAAEQKRIDTVAAVAPALKRAGLRLWLAESSGVAAVERAVPGVVAALRPLADVWQNVPPERMADFFRTVSASGGCIVSTSSYEGLGLAYVEAQACGCPAIGPDVRGVNEAVRPDQGGVLYPFATPPERLAQLVIETVTDLEGMQRRRELAVRFAREHFGLDRMVSEYIAIYRAVLRKERRSLRERSRRLLLLLSPRDYILRNWSAAQALYAVSRAFSARGESRLAAQIAWTSFLMCPTIYARPRRLAHLLAARLPRRPRAVSPGV